MDVTPRILLTGGSGLLGGNVLSAIPKEWKAYSVSSENFDLTAGDISGLVDEYRPTVIIHAAALTNVDRCETDREAARALHADATKKLANAARAAGAHLVHISTDHIFDGNRGKYGEDDKPQPVNFYAETKFLGEQAVVASGADAAIIRTNFFGFNVQEKEDFAGWLLSALQKKEPLRLFTDVIFSPILVNTLSDRIIDIVRGRKMGVFHIAAHDACSKYDFGMMLARAFGLDTAMVAAASIDDAPQLVRRPKNMSLDVSKSEERLGIRFPTVAESIAAYKKLFDDNYQETLRSYVFARYPQLLR